VTDFTEDMRRKARETRAAQAAYAAAQYKHKWLDEPLWLELAEKRGFRLPGPSAKLTPGKLNSWARKAAESTVSELFGCSGKRLMELNPRTPLRAFVGQMLEMA